MANKSYSEKLKDPRWQKKRLKILDRDNWACTLCSDDKTTLNVHHEKYHGEPWEAKDEHLKTLCVDCHELVTFLTDVNLVAIKTYKVWSVTGLKLFLVQTKYKKHDEELFWLIQKEESKFEVIVVPRPKKLIDALKEFIS